MGEGTGAMSGETIRGGLGVAAGRPLVSVVVPTHNSADHVAQCVDSLLAQTMSDLEVVCVDDGSTDDTLELLRGYEARDARVSVIAQGNAGPGAARNRGIEAAQGTYLYFLDSDDWADPELLERAVGRLQETGAQIVIFPYLELDERVGEVRATPWAVLEESYQGDVFSWHDNPDWIFRSMQNLMWNKVFSADLIRREGIRCEEDVRLTEDLMFTAPALVAADRLTYLHEAHVYHRSGTGGNTMAHKDAHPLDFLTAFMTFRRWLEARGVYQQLQIAYVNWAADACMYNMHTLHSLEGFRLVYGRLTEQDGLRELGLLDVPVTAYHEPRFQHMIERMQVDPVEEYLFRQFQEYRDSADLGWYTNDVTRAKLDGERRAREGAERRGNELQARLDAEVTERQAVEAELDVARAERDRAQAEVEALRQSTSFKLGNAVVDPAVRFRRALRHEK